MRISDWSSDVCSSDLDACDAACRVGAAAEAKQVDSVAGAVMLQDCFVAIGNVRAYTNSGDRARQRAQEVDQTQPHHAATGSCAQSGIVKRHLLRRIDRTIRTTACGAVKFVDVAQHLIGSKTARLPGSVCKDKDVLAHGLRSEEHTSEFQ